MYVLALALFVFVAPAGVVMFNFMCKGKFYEIPALLIAWAVYIYFGYLSVLTYQNYLTEVGHINFDPAVFALQSLSFTFMIFIQIALLLSNEVIEL